MSNLYPAIPAAVEATLAFRSVAVGSSSVVSYNSFEDLDREHDEGDCVLVPTSILPQQEDEYVHVYYSKCGGAAYTLYPQDVDISNYDSPQEAWENAIYEVVGTLNKSYPNDLKAPEVIEAAKTLILSEVFWLD